MLTIELVEPVMSNELKFGMVVRRRSGVSLGHLDRSLPEGHPLEITDVMTSGVYCEDLEDFDVRYIPRRLANTDAFEVLAEGRTDGPAIKIWMADRRAAFAEVTPDVLVEDLARFGVKTSPEVVAWLAELLSESSVTVDAICTKFSRLADPFFWPPSMMAEFDQWMESLGEDGLHDLLLGNPPKLWRRTCVAIGRVLVDPDRYSPAIVSAARSGLLLQRPTPL